MKEEILKEIMKECNIKTKDEVIIKALLSICKYYKIN